MFLKKIKSPLWLFTVAVISIIFLPSLFQKGMFVDGVTYAAVANNIANHIGTFWEPHYTLTLGNNFSGHPPLYIWILSTFYNLFGSAFFIERLFSYVLFLLLIFIIIKAWKTHHQDNTPPTLSWLPVILMLTVPLVPWAYKNNLLENLLNLFTILSSIFIFKSIAYKKILFAVGGGFLIVLAILTKGPVGLFPIAIPFIYFIVFKNYKIKDWLVYGLTPLLVVLSVLGILYLSSPGFQTFVGAYISDQLLPVMQKESATTNNRFKILLDILLEIAAPLALMIFAWFYNKKRKLKFNKKLFLYYVLIGLSASLPLILSLKQRKFYALPSIFFFVMAAAIILKPIIVNLYNSLTDHHFSKLKFVSKIIISTSIILCVYNYGSYSRMQDKIQDLETISQRLPAGTLISCTNDQYYDWYLHAYLSRLNHISIDPDHEQEFAISPLGSENDLESKGYEKLAAELNEMELWRKE